MTIQEAHEFWKKRIFADPNVEIKQCSDPHMWYSDRVGQTIPVVKVDRDGLWAREPAGYINIIRFEDV